jgi:hypothetical protein
VKSGEIVPENISFEHALRLLLENPLLIRRPLMEIGEERQVGFDIVAVDAWIGLKNVDLPEGNIEACVHGPEGHGSCGQRQSMRTRKKPAMAAAALTDRAVEIAPGVHWVGALDPHLRSFDIILKTANGTTYNAYVVRGENGVAIIDTVKESFADDFFRASGIGGQVRRNHHHRSQPSRAGPQRRAARIAQARTASAGLSRPAAPR